MAASLTTVFGGTGFLGRHTVRALLAADHRVRVATRRGTADFDDERVEPVAVDVRDSGAVAAAVAGASGVINTVGLYVARGAETFDAIHVGGARNVAVAAAGAGIRLVHLSGIGADEHSASAYVRARARGEQAVLATAVSSVILRPSVLFGPDDALLSTLERITSVLPLVPLFGDGSTRLQPVYVADVAEAAVRALTVTTAGSAIYELGGPRHYRYRELIEEVLAHLNRRRLLLPVPFAVWSLQSACLAVLPNPPLTRDQVILMRADNVVGEHAQGFSELGIQPQALADLLPQCLPPAAVVRL